MNRILTAEMPGIVQRKEHIRTGAEARIYRGSFSGIGAIIKERYPRHYREPALDNKLRQHRTRSEARLIREAREAGVPTPHLLDLDLKNSVIVMEFLPFPSLKQVLSSGEQSSSWPAFLRETGRLVGLLHSHGIVHGDLTTSNILVNGKTLHLIDFGLSEKIDEIEAMGVDLHVFSEAFESTHSGLLPLLKEFFEGYLTARPESGKGVVQRAAEISRRGRYH